VRQDGPMAAAQAQVHLIDLGDVTLRTSTRGQGPPLLLITGLGASLELGAPFEKELSARGVHVISFDAPGIGGSTPYSRPRRLAGIAETLTRLLDQLGHDHVDVLGISLGGAVAQQLAHQAPQRVRSLVLAATAYGVGGVPGSPHALLPLATPRRYRDPDYYRQVAGRIYGGQARTDPGLLLRGHNPAHPPSLRGYLGQLYAISGWSSLPWLHTIPHPTLVLAGDDDPIVPLINGRILAARIPNASLHIVKAGGHLFVLERPAHIADLVTGFLHQSPHAPSRRGGASRSLAPAASADRRGEGPAPQAGSR
jgi:poly(3-hydroxyoctanoate) depolymerase